MTAEFDQVAALLLKLDVSELAEVKARAGILAQGGGSKRLTASADAASIPAEIAAESDVDLVLSEIAGHMRSEGIEFASLKQLRGMTNFRSFEAKIPPSMEYFRKITRNKVKLRALIHMSIGMLYKDLAKMNVSASTRTMMNHWHRIPAVINSHFPGYAKIGMLGVLVNSGSLDLRYVNDAAREDEDDVRN